MAAPRAEQRRPGSCPAGWSCATLLGSAGLRALYGFLLLFLAFAIREGTLDHDPRRRARRGRPRSAWSAAALGLGTFLATAVGTGLRIRRPARLQAIGLCVVAVVGRLGHAAVHACSAVLLLCLVTAVASGLAKLAVDASIQERIPETVRASAFAHAETLLMLAWVAGGALGLIPFERPARAGRVATLAMMAAAVRAVVAGWRCAARSCCGRAAATPPAPVRPPVPAAAAAAGTRAVPAPAPAVGAAPRRAACRPASRSARKGSARNGSGRTTTTRRPGTTSSARRRPTPACPTRRTGG